MVVMYCYVIDKFAREHQSFQIVGWPSISKRSSTVQETGRSMLGLLLGPYHRPVVEYVEEEIAGLSR